ncbi:hypothetical protein HYZ97_01985 [Candidatus Pacearchaeota archaeon]|nr:hypothetical protein [Candidatus Pacearchaeota archaeon]
MSTGLENGLVILVITESKDSPASEQFRRSAYESFPFGTVLEYATPGEEEEHKLARPLDEYTAVLLEPCLVGRYLPAVSDKEELRMPETPECGFPEPVQMRLVRKSR